MLKWWMDLTTEEFRGIDPSRALAVIPVGAVEQHGPHLAVSVDADILEGIVAGSAQYVPDDLPVYVLPQLSIGKSSEHQAFPGTLTLTPETVLRLWTDVAESVIRTGFRKLVFVNSHGGQPQIMDIVVRDLRVRHGVLAVSANCYGLGLPPDLFDPEQVDHDIHGGAIETSMMLHLRPDRVRLDRAADFRSLGQQMQERYRYLQLEGTIGIGWMTQDVNPAGAVGNALDADAERGALCIDYSARALAELFAEVSDFPLSWLVEK